MGMDVPLQRTGGKRLDTLQQGPVGLSRPGAERKPSVEWIGEVLGEWQARELRIARSFGECRGLNTQQLEDIYQETALVLLRGRYLTEEHLRNALRDGLKKRALNVHRNDRRRGEILAYNAPGLHRTAQAREISNAPEVAALKKQDRAIVSEFLTELSTEEQRVFWLIAEGMQYRAIAPVLDIDVNQARKVARSCERKRERFQLLYDTGRLCGFRSVTIQALQAGESTSEELAKRAFAHLDSCGRCRTEHQTNATRLRRSFEGQAAALLPLPALAGHLGWLARLSIRARILQSRLLADGFPLGQGGVRERAAALLASSGVTAKVAAGAAIVAMIAGGTVGARHVLDDPTSHYRHHAARATVERTQAQATPANLLKTPITPATDVSSPKAPHSSRHKYRASPGRVPPSVDRATAHSARNEPGGFAYLGVPTSTSGLTSAPEHAHSAARSGGGPFSP
jgi:RNA polymerase sigma factor (sigma-70 family)